MAGIYIHIPFCKQACHYCDFHFSTNLNTKSDLITAILMEIELQKEYLSGEVIETIYFGGGTPSLLSSKELSSILNKIRENFTITATPEITLEANPDDLTTNKLKELKVAGVNRLSIGIQSFRDEELRFFNRAHHSKMAIEAVRAAQRIGIDNISIDLIFASPNQSIKDLKYDLDQALELKTPHISIYGLTIEENTVFGKWQAQNKLDPIDDDLFGEQLELIMSTLQKAGYDQYEISNFSKPGFTSRHNSSYWTGEKYLGIGPSAHSYNGIERQSNDAHNMRYIRQINDGKIPCTVETLSRENLINEFILIRLRLKSGMDYSILKELYGYDILEVKSSFIQEFVEHKLLELSNNFLRLTSKGKLLADFITEKLII
ncbi:MAG: radical SAM family heme chaperone HemW [Reichenbachiella sp.]|uniref:radical SAM family heme chaperone HemW n=1 Tax=Reichenbachiella sp. TaxID=2184521 RepID=UPI00326744FF